MSVDPESSPSEADSEASLSANPAADAPADPDDEGSSAASAQALRVQLLLAAACLVAVVGIVASAWAAGMSSLRERRAAKAEDAPAAPEPAAASASRTAPADDGPLQVVRVPRLGEDDPDAPLWDGAPIRRVSFLPQTLARPQLPDPSVRQLSVQGARDEQRVAFRVTWRDPSRDENVEVNRFTDAVAIGFPIDENAPPMMGAKGLRMQILYWKALWQKDIDEHFQDVQDLHPNFWSDLYWFAEGEFPYPVPQAFQRPESRQWFPAQQAGNPMADFEREQPVQELFAEGWGSLTPQQESVTTAKGRWRDGYWSVVFSRPLASEDPLDADLERAQGQIAFAAWNGSAGNRGARKQWAGWVPYELSDAPAPAPARALNVHSVTLLPEDDPAAPAWAEAPSLGVPLMPQQMTRPQQASGTISYVRVRALSDGERLSLRVTWRDPQPDHHVEVGRFCDAVAVGFPLDPETPPMMGAKDLPMQILYWKALWQKDVDEGFQDVQDLHPNFWSDLYWFAEGEFPYPIPESFRRAESRLWFPAQQAGNPVSRFEREQPVQELSAAGWGTLTHQEESVSTGRGAYRDGAWSVVFTRPLRTDDPRDAQLGFASQTRRVAFAVWNGATGDRGARKNWSATWVDLRLETSN